MGAEMEDHKHRVRLSGLQRMRALAIISPASFHEHHFTNIMFLA
jgi:hypothetical protein